MCNTFHGMGKIVNITQGTKVTYLYLLMPFGKPHTVPKEARMVCFNANGTEGQPPWIIFNIVSSYDSYGSKRLKLNVSSHAKRYTLYITFDQPLWWKTPQIRESELEYYTCIGNSIHLYYALLSGSQVLKSC